MNKDRNLDSQLWTNWLRRYMIIKRASYLNFM